MMSLRDSLDSESIPPMTRRAALRLAAGAAVAGIGIAAATSNTIAASPAVASKPIPLDVGTVAIVGEDGPERVFLFMNGLHAHSYALTLSDEFGERVQRGGPTTMYLDSAEDGYGTR